MTRTRAHGGAPNAFVAENATRRGVIPLDEVALLGVAGPQGAMRAIIRMSDGDIVTGALGERIALGELVEVSPAGVVIEVTNGFAAFLRPYPWGQDRAPG